MRWISFLSGALFLFIASANAEDLEVTVVTYGSTIKLEHKATKFRLHSHDVSYGTGSKQQSVTAHHDLGDSNSFWLVKSAHGVERPIAGAVVKCGDKIRLQHLQTKKNLHSHKHYAPLNRDFEVSAYRSTNEKWAIGDEGDDWIIECVGKETEWKRFHDIRLMHALDKTFLTASLSQRYGDPIPGQLQVSAGRRKNANTVWKTNEGFYVGPKPN